MNMSKSSVLNVVLALVLCLAVVGGILTMQPQNGHEPAPHTRTVRVAYLPIVTSLPVFVSQDQQLFKQRGIDAEFVEMRTSNQEIEALIRGDVDIVAISSAIPVLRAEQVDPGNLVVFSSSLPTTDEKPFDAILTREETGILSLNDLEGRNIGVFPGSTATNMLKAYLEQNGVRVNDMNFVPLAPPNQLAALEGGAIDALHAYEPTISTAREVSGVRQLHGSVYMPLVNHTQGFAVVSRRFLEDHRELAHEVIEVLDTAYEIAATDESTARALLETHMGLTPEAAGNTALLDMTSSYALDASYLQSYADVLFELGELDAPFDIRKILYQSHSYGAPGE